MRATNWTAATDFASVCRRASGRRRHNARRRLLADRRRYDMCLMLAGHPGWIWSARYVQSTLAEVFGVHRSTICRDFAELRRPRLRIFRSAPFRRLLKIGLSPERRKAFMGDDQA